MVTFLITSVLFLGLVAIAIYFWQKPANTTETIELPPPPVTTLFPGEDAKQLKAPVQEPEVLKPAAEINEPDRHKRIPDELIESWRQSPDRASTTRLIHEAAVTDDADTYRTVVELVLTVWQEKGISGMSAAELQTLFNSEFWILSSAVRSSGAGFVLKRTLSRAKRDLERVNNPT